MQEIVQEPVLQEAIAYVDGASHGNPGPAGVGAIIQHGDYRVEISEPIGAHDNNYAEYAALLVVLRYAVTHGCTRVRVFSDSEVVVRQINGHYNCRSPLLRHIYQLCLSLIGSLEAFSLTHIKREINAEADELARLAVYRSKRYHERRDHRPIPAEVFA